jgi:hypothetical protein
MRIKAMENFTDVKLEIFVPKKYALTIRNELSKIGVGRIENYDPCVATYPVQGYYHPRKSDSLREVGMGEIREHK